MKWPKWLSIWIPLFWIFVHRSEAACDLPKGTKIPHKDVGATAAYVAVQLAAVRDHAREVQDAEYRKACLDFKAFLDQCFLSCSAELETALANNLAAYHRFKYKIDDPAVVHFLKPIMYYCELYKLEGWEACRDASSFYNHHTFEYDCLPTSKFNVTPAPYYIKEFHKLTKGYVSLEINFIGECKKSKAESVSITPNLPCASTDPADFICTSCIVIDFSVRA